MSTLIEIPVGKLLAFGVKLFRKEFLKRYEYSEHAIKEINQLLVSEMEDMKERLDLLLNSEIEAAIRHLKLAHEVLGYISDRQGIEEAQKTAASDFKLAAELANAAYSKITTPQRVLATKILIDSALNLHRHEPDAAIAKCIAYIQLLVETKEIALAFGVHLETEIAPIKMFGREERFEIVWGVWDVIDTVLKVICELVQSAHRIQALPPPVPFAYLAGTSTTTVKNLSFGAWFSKLLDGVDGHPKFERQRTGMDDKKWLLGLEEKAKEGGAETYIEEKWENQRFWISGWAMPGTLDPPHFSSEDLKQNRELLQPPRGWIWTNSWKLAPLPDDAEWLYAFNFDTTWRPHDMKTSFVRRRKWVRTRKKTKTPAPGTMEKLNHILPYDRLFETTATPEDGYDALVAEYRGMLLGGVHSHLSSFCNVLSRLPGIHIGPAVKPFTFQHGSVMVIREFTEFVRKERIVYNYRRKSANEKRCVVCENDFTLFRLRRRCKTCRNTVCNECSAGKEEQRICTDCQEHNESQHLEELREIFNCLDTDKSGEIELGELQAGLRIVDIEMKLEDIIPMIISADTDEDYQLEFDEFVVLMKEQPFLLNYLKKLKLASTTNTADIKIWYCPICSTENEGKNDICKNTKCGLSKLEVEERVIERVGVVVYIGSDCSRFIRQHWTSTDDTHIDADSIPESPTDIRSMVPLISQTHVTEPGASHPKHRKRRHSDPGSNNPDVLLSLVEPGDQRKVSLEKRSVDENPTKEAAPVSGNEAVSNGKDDETDDRPEEAGSSPGTSADIISKSGADDGAGGVGEVVEKKVNRNVDLHQSVECSTDDISLSLEEKDKTITNLNRQITDLKRMLQLHARKTQPLVHNDQLVSEIHYLKGKCADLETEVVEARKTSVLARQESEQLKLKFKTVESPSATPESSRSSISVVDSKASATYTFAEKEELYRVVDQYGVCYRKTPIIIDKIVPSDGVLTNDIVTAMKVKGDWIQLWNGYWLPLKVDDQVVLQKTTQDDIDKLLVDKRQSRWRMCTGSSCEACK